MKRVPLFASIAVIGATVLLNYLVPKPGHYHAQRDHISRLIPFRINDWKSEGDLPVDEDSKRILGTDDILHRHYSRGRESGRVLLSLVFSAGHRHSMHPPEVCYQSQGFKLISRRTTELEPDCEATVLELAGSGRVDTLVNYWFFSQGRETSSYMKHQLHLILNQVFFQTHPSVLLRLSTEVSRGDVKRAQSLLRDFAEAAIPVLRENLSIPSLEPQQTAAGTGEQ